MSDDERDDDDLDSDNPLNQARAETLTSLRKPRDDVETRILSKVGSTAPFVVSIFLSEMHAVHQLLKAEIGVDEDGKKTGNLKDFRIDRTLESDYAKDFVNYLLETGMGVNSERAKLLSKVLEGIGKETSSRFGNLMPNLNKEMEEEVFEEVPANE